MAFTSDGAAAVEFGFFWTRSLVCAAKFRFFRIFGAGEEPPILADHLIEYSCGKYDYDWTITKGDMDKIRWGIG